jgi:hypothetical protein
MDVNSEKEVYFDQYCKLCKYQALTEDKDPCDECLDNPVNTDSHKPVNFKEK